MRVTIIHLDLGIGGAERLVVNFACQMKELGHDLTIVTSHHELTHCFEETKVEGVLGGDIKVYGDWIPRQILGKGTAFFAIIRMIYITIASHVNMKIKSEVVFLDGVSAPIPLLQMINIPVLFYCHFPDKLLCVERSSVLKRLYRLIIDKIEDTTTGCANVIAVNSEFTAKTFRQSFAALGKIYKPSVLYPTITLPVAKVFRNDVTGHTDQILPYTVGFQEIFVSLNRFERKKNVRLAVEAFHHLSQRPVCQAKAVLLVVAGGCDQRVTENTEYLAELRALVDKFGLQKCVEFRTNISTEERESLLSQATALLYTPDNEHFGIVPIEAMALECPVVAVRSGGPMETVLHEVTGFLCDQKVEAFSAAMARFLSDQNLSKAMGKAGRKHVEEKFTITASKVELDRLLVLAASKCESDRVKENLFWTCVCLSSVGTVLLAIISAMFFLIGIFYYPNF